MKGHWTVVALLLGGLLFVSGLERMRREVALPAQLALKTSREALRKADLLRTTGRRRAAGTPRWPGAFALACPSDARGLARLGPDIVMATGGGLVLLPVGGQPARHYTALDGLPMNGLTSVAIFRGTAWFGTAGAGLVEASGRELIQHRFDDERFNRVMTLTVWDDRLVVGSTGGGVATFDGLAFRRLAAPEQNHDLSKVTALAAGPRGLAVGTAETGLLLFEGASARSGGAGLERVTALLWNGDELLVGTPYGLHRWDARQAASTMLPDVHVTALAREPDGTILVGTFEGDLHRLRGPIELSTAVPQPWIRLSSPIASILCDEGALWVATARGVRRFAGGAWKPVGLPPGLSRPHVNALERDGSGNLWIGYFAGGVDWCGDGPHRASPVAGLEDCSGVNQLRWEARSGRMIVATTHGVLFHDGRSVVRTLTASQGLAGESVAFSLPGKEGWAYGSERGVTLERDGRLQSITAFQGLASNHVYCGEYFAGQLVVGTLGGLSFLDGTRVLKNVAASAKGLPANWTTVLLALPTGLLVGTYGGGAALLGPDGSWTPVPGRKAKFEVNVGAALQVGGRVVLGTVSQGLVAFDLDGSAAAALTDGLGHPDVTSLATDGRYLFAGTEGGVTAIPLEQIR